MNKRQKTNLIMWGIFSIILIILAGICLLTGYTVGMKIMSFIFSALSAWILVMTINAWIFNWAAKKFFDKWFKK